MRETDAMTDYQCDGGQSNDSIRHEMLMVVMVKLNKKVITNIIMIINI